MKSWQIACFRWNTTQKNASFCLNIANESWPKHLPKITCCFCDWKEKRPSNTDAPVDPSAEKFNIVSNDHGRTHKYYFSLSDQKFPFSAKLVQKIKIAVLSWNLVTRLIWISRIQWWCSLFPFLAGNKLLVWSNLV